jgi:hypothetical protein
LSTSELACGGKASASGGLAPVSSGGTIEVLMPLASASQITSLPNALLRRIGAGRLVIGAQNPPPGPFVAPRRRTWLGGSAPPRPLVHLPSNLNLIIGPEPADVFGTPNGLPFPLTSIPGAAEGQSYDSPPRQPPVYPVYDTTLKRDLFAAIANANRPGCLSAGGIYDRLLPQLGVASPNSPTTSVIHLLIRSTHRRLESRRIVTISDFIDLLPLQRIRPRHHLAGRRSEGQRRHD